jgi:hypothetical protein
MCQSRHVDVGQAAVAGVNTEQKENGGEFSKKRYIYLSSGESCFN